jgi:ribonuclease HI
MKILNIFSDASMMTDPRNNTSIGCAGAVAVYGNKDVVEETKEVLYGFTNNMSELTGIKMALQLALKYRESYDQINIISDSRLCVETFKDWIYRWMNNIKPDLTLVSSSDEPVKNQQIIMDCVNFIIQNNLKFNLYHIRGHILLSNESKIKEAYRSFIKVNGFAINRETLEMFIYYNNKIDFDTRTFLEEYYNNYLSCFDPPNHPTQAIVCIPSRDEMDVYSRLINHKGF